MEQAAQQRDKFVAGEVFNFVRMDREHAAYLARPMRRRNDRLTHNPKFSPAALRQRRRSHLERIALLSGMPIEAIHVALKMGV